MRKTAHVGIIPDGSRRWAKREGVSLFESYLLAMRRLEEIIGACFQWGVEAVSVYLLSKANLKRSQYDLDSVAEAERLFLSEMVPALVREHSVSIRIAGLVNCAPAQLQVGIDQLRAHQDVANVVSPSEGKKRLYLCIAYDPIDELAVAKEQDFRTNGIKSLWVPEKIDLIVRTGGAVTISDFLPLQSGYARIIFLDHLFNDFKKDELLGILGVHEGMALKFGE